MYLPTPHIDPYPLNPRPSTHNQGRPNSTPLLHFSSRSITSSHFIDNILFTCQFSIDNHITLHHAEQLVAVLQQYIHACSRQSSVAPSASTFIGQQPAAKRTGGTAVVCTYVHVCMGRLKCAAKHLVAPDCEISDGAPIAGQHMNSAVKSRSR